ncbi:MAG: AAA family ATPase [Promethearchaeota archaeon]
MPKEKASLSRAVIPFSAIVDREELKLALLLNAVNPRIGGLLISGPKGTGKTTIVRALATLLPQIPVVKGCQFQCNPTEPTYLCEKCAATLQKQGKLTTEMQRMRVIDLPLSATEDRVVGSLDVEKAITKGIAALKPGILAAANQHILYVDEVNLLPDHIVDALLDAAAMGVNFVEREGVSVSHPSRFIFIGSMNPEEGELRPQLLDRFPLYVSIQRPFSGDERVAVIQLNIAFERDPDALRSQWEGEEAKLRDEIIAARKLMPQVQVPDEVTQVIALLCSQLQVDGVRPDIVIAKAAMAFAALDGHTEVTTEDVEVVAPLALSHRTRQRGILEPPTRQTIGTTLMQARKKVKTENPQAKDRDSGPKEERRRLVDKFRKFHGLDESHDGERYDARAPRRKTGGRLSWTGLVCFYFLIAATIGIYLTMLLPLFLPLNFIVGGFLAYGMLKLLERVLRRSPRPGSVLPALSESDSIPEGSGKFKRATHKGSSSSPPTTAATPPSKSKLTPRVSGETGERKPISLPSIIRLDEGRPLFDVKDLLHPTLFRRQRAPKWSIRQVWRRAGSIMSRQAEGGGLVGGGLPRGVPRNIYLPATITAASLHSKPSSSHPLAVQINSSDVREKRFRSSTPLTIIFVIDLSVSMLKSFEKLQQSIIAFKTCFEGTRDRVGLIALKDWGAAEVQAPTANWNRLLAKLMTLRISGYTPLAAGLKQALETIKRERRRNPGMVPLIVVLSDFLPNIRLASADSLDLGLAEPIADVLHQCHLLANAKVPLVTVNLHKEFFRIKGKRHHDVILESLQKRAKETGIPNLVEIGLREDKLIPFLAFYMAYITGGRVFLGEELNNPSEIMPAIISIARRGTW